MSKKVTLDVVRASLECNAAPVERIALSNGADGVFEMNGESSYDRKFFH